MQDTSANELFEEYLDRWVEGKPLETEELERRAGPEAADLREKFQLMHELSDLSLLMDEEAAPATDKLDRIAHYEIREVLGEGGLSRVYLAQDTQLEKERAIKVLNLAALDSDKARTWMLEEARSLARVEHDSVVRVHNVGECDGIAYLVMDYVRGPSLLKVIEELRWNARGEAMPSTPRPSASAAAALRGTAARCLLVARLARALHAIHQVDVTHGDVKPGNVLLDQRNVPKLIDFGLARRAGADHQNLGGQEAYATLPYLAPELIANGNREANSASDQYALGVLFYELLTLVHPLVRENRAATWASVSHPSIAPPRTLRPEIPADVERICMHALEREPEQRYASLEALADDIESFLDHRAISLGEPSLARRAWLTARRHPLHFAILLLVSSIVAWTLGSLIMSHSERDRLLVELEGSLQTALGSERPQHDLLQFFSDVSRAKEDARRLDQARFAGLFFSPITPRIEGFRQRGHLRLHEHLEREFGEAMKGKQPLQDDRRCEKVAAEWGAAAVFESLSSEDGVCDSPFHQLGTIALPDGAELLRYADGKHPNFPVLEPVDRHGRLAPGLYRVRGVVGGMPWEIDVVGLTYTPPRVISHHELRPDLAERLVSHAGRMLPLYTSGSAVPEVLAGADEDDVYRVAPIQIAAGPCTWMDVGRVLEEPAFEAAIGIAALRQGVDRSALDPGSPAFVPWVRAHECVTGLGVRLPTAAELWSALKSGDIEPIPGCKYEWTAAVDPNDPALRMRLIYPKPGEPSDEFPRLDPVSDYAWMSPTGFRFVVPSE